MNPKVWSLRTWVTFLTIITTPLFFFCSFFVPWGTLDYYEGMISYYWYPLWILPIMLSGLILMVSIGAGEDC